MQLRGPKMPNGAMRYTVMVIATLALAACSSDKFLSEAGTEFDAGGFGNATMNNSLVMSGNREFIVSLTRKFAQDVPNTVNFAFNSDVLDANAQAALVKQADWIKQFPEVKFRVYGHTDLVGSNAYNKSLGLRRARAVVNFLTGHGISRSRLEAVVSFGETQPLVYTQDPNEQNRRTVTEVTGLIKREPQFLNGKYAELIFRDYVSSATPAMASDTDKLGD
ncbi:outer membrane protein OmpA-like peptidoglycan-associated protein [Rhodobacter aestuarii]|uniref:Outer membrane protein OmpA n=2 Tax=Rhodobacter group TaxID=3374108 RepID=A0A1N7N6E1_9RHOB|nr:outer membrane protein OmpA-like peptidoglycan-associated protein [Rhodobacter aestuarii]SIS93900.1 Outer membrane protein OmpA [Rhodobacter aestuarii]SOB93325.1 outer membrane protein OmpA-like peptidoglycan-associated protein [Rhodobacter sp. JA431]